MPRIAPKAARAISRIGLAVGAFGVACFVGVLSMVRTIINELIIVWSKMDRSYFRTRILIEIESKEQQL